MPATIRFRAQLLLGGALLAITATPAFAAGRAAAPAAPAATPPAADPAPAEPAAAADQGPIQDVVVTALKRETNLQATPISISVLSTEAIADRHVQSLFNLADGAIPSLRVATFEARQSALTIGIRGIVPYDQNQTARDGGVSVYIDGVALGKTQGLNAALFDVQRIEVLKGPQGTLFGRNTEGGALSLVTKAPTGVFGGRVVGGIGNYGSRQGEIHLDLPAVANISVKLDGVYQHQDPTVKDPLPGSTGWNYYDRKGGRVAARWKPSDNFTADLAYDYAKDENTPQYSQLLSYNPNGYNVGSFTNPGTGVVGTSLFYNGTACNTANGSGGVNNPCIAPKAPLVGVHPERQTVADVGVPQQPSVDITHGFSATLSYRPAQWVELRSITAWRGVKTDQWDNSGGPERVTFQPSISATTGVFSRYSLSFMNQHQFSQELQAVGHFDQIDYVLGAYYYTEYANEYAATPSSNQWNIDGTAYTIRSPIVTGTLSGTNSGYAFGSQFITRDSEAWDHNYSLFGNATYTPSGLDALHVTAGGRWTKDKRHGRLFIVNGIATPFTFENSISRFDPMFNIAFDASQDVHLYAKYSTGFRAGGANDRSQSFNQFAPESVKSYEIGAKMDFLDRHARLNLAGYIMNRSNTQFDFDLYDTQAGSPTFNSHIEQTVNAGTTKISGIEADLTLKPVSALTLTASYAYTHIKAPSAVNPTLGGPPQQLYIVYTPEHAASGAIDYELQAGFNDASLRFHLDANYASSQYSFQLEPTKTDPSFVVNGRIALTDIAVNDHNKVTIALWSRNLLNHTYVYRRSAANSSPVLNYCGSNGLNGAAACTPNALISTNYGGILGDYGNLNPPRTWGVEISAKF